MNNTKTFNQLIACWNTIHSFQKEKIEKSNISFNRKETLLDVLNEGNKILININNSNRDSTLLNFGSTVGAETFMLLEKEIKKHKKDIDSKLIDAMFSTANRFIRTDFYKEEVSIKGAEVIVLNPPYNKSLESNSAILGKNKELIINQETFQIYEKVFSRKTSLTNPDFISLSLFLSRFKKNNKNQQSNESKLLKSIIVFYLEVGNGVLTNKDVVGVFKKHFNNILNLKHQEYYHFVSRMIGEKNYNIVNGKRIILSNYFNQEFKYPNQLNSFTIGIENLNKKIEIPERGLISVFGSSNQTLNPFLYNLASQNLKNKKRVLFINLEGSKKSFLFKIISSLTGIPYANIKTGQLTEEENKRVELTAQEYSNLTNIENLAGDFHNNIEDLKTMIQNKKNTFDFDIVLINYAQLLTFKDVQLDKNKTLSKILQNLSDIGRQTNSVIITPVLATNSEYHDLNITEAIKCSDLSLKVEHLSDNLFSLKTLQGENNSFHLNFFKQKNNEPTLKNIKVNDNFEDLFKEFIIINQKYKENIDFFNQYKKSKSVNYDILSQLSKDINKHKNIRNKLEDMLMKEKGEISELSLKKMIGKN
jgi:hypothetical protein